MRRDPPNETLLPARRNVRPVENIVAHVSPDPIRESEFANVGRAGGAARMPIATAFSMASIRAVAEDNWSLVDHTEFDMHAPNASRANGRMEPYSERANIDRKSAVAYGSLFSLQPPVYT